MAARVGSHIGPYEITAEIGSGGMGVVYRATDTRLRRDVAIKMATGPLTDRFEREARAVAALNHPNICTIHDVGSDYLVMELVDGETLADLIARHAGSSAGSGAGLGVDESLRIARQIAFALEAAHDAGIVHRDLKPANIKIKPDGTVKVLDFGLAKMAEADGGGAIAADASRSPTMASPAVTGVGVILGTAAYMSPEQARGRAADKRADIWAFGVVLYEMVTGQRPFAGEDVPTVAAAVIQSEPRWDVVPVRLHRLLKKCLAKDPRQRLRDIGDAWALLDDVPSASSASSSRTSPGWLAAGALALVAAVAAWAPWRGAAPAPDRPLVRLEVDLGADVALQPLDQPTPSSVAISGDGTRIAYVARLGSGPQALWTQRLDRLDQPDAIELPGTVGAGSPSLSPDGNWVVFVSGQGAKKVAVDGSEPVPLLDTSVYSGAHWAEDGNLYVGSGLTAGGVKRVPAGGGAATSLLDLVDGEVFQVSPQLLPGGRALLMTSVPPPPALPILQVVSLENSSRKTIVSPVTRARYLPSGHLIYGFQNRLFAVPFDLATLEMRGTPVQILDDMAFDLAAGFPQFDVSENGTLIYRPGRAGGTATLRWVDAGGGNHPVLANEASFRNPRLSADGQRLAVAIRDRNSQDIFVYDIQRSVMTPLTRGEAYERPVWTPDGQYLVFGALTRGLLWARADGGGQPQALVPSPGGVAFPGSFTPNGGTLAFAQFEGGGFQIMTVAIDQNGGLKAGAPQPYLAPRLAGLNPVFSPNGRWLAYQSPESGVDEVYVRPFPSPPDGSGLVKISNGGGASPNWSRAADELLYLSGTQLMAVPYTVNGNVFTADAARPWGTVKSVGSAFDLAPEGKRALVVVPTASAGREHTVVFLQNFFDELRRRVPLPR